jgi:membrane peptidoglycan carboxypeptidase
MTGPASTRTRTVVPPPPSKGVRGWWARRSKRQRRVLASVVIGFFAIFVAICGVVYAAIRIPLPNRINTAQTTVITYRDGSELARIGSVNRTNVPLSQVPVPVRNAVLAAEDHKYYSEPGISYRGIARALWTDVRGGEVSQGGSTITQQYAKNAYLTSQRTFSRKLKEIVIAVKLNRKYSKDQILEFYLNTIYFGRGAYGIQAASHAYFGVDVSKLTPEQGAVLAGLIRAPSTLDPRVNPRASQQRWHQVIDAMVKYHWMDAQRAASAKFPPTLPSTGGGGVAAPSSPEAAFIRDRVDYELTHEDGISEDLIQRGGLKVTTTLDVRLQSEAVGAVERAIRGAPAALQAGLVAVEPSTGRVRAYYPGNGYGSKGRRYVDNATYESVQPGSSFKPIVLAAALAKGIGLNSVYDGHSPQMFPGYPAPGVSNFTQNGVAEQPGYINLTQATAMSINTVFVHLGLDVGEANVVKMARALGISDNVDLPSVTSLPLGVVSVTPYDMAAVYGAFAGGGTTSPSHLVSKVTDPSGNVIYSEPDRRTRAISTDVDRDVTSALQTVFTNPQGTAAGNPLANGRPAAGKTGTTSGNQSAWFCGYTPQLAAVVDVFRDDHQPLQNLLGYSEVAGATVPLGIWKDFMDSALANAPIAQFQQPANVGTSVSSAPPPPAPPSTSAAPTTSAPTSKKSTSPTVEPTGTLSQTPTTPSAVPPPTLPTATPTAGGPPNKGGTPSNQGPSGNTGASTGAAQGGPP